MTQVKIKLSQAGSNAGDEIRERKMFDVRQEDLPEDQLAGFIFRVPGVVLKTKGSEVVFKLLMSKGGEDEEKSYLLKLMRKEDEELNLKKKTKNMRMMKNQIRMGLLRALRYSK